MESSRGIRAGLGNDPRVPGKIDSERNHCREPGKTEGNGTDLSNDHGALDPRLHSTGNRFNARKTAPKFPTDRLARVPDVYQRW